MNTIPPDPDAKVEWWLWLKLLVEAQHNPALFTFFLSLAVLVGLIKLASLVVRRPPQAVQEAASNPNPRRRQQLPAVFVGFLTLLGIAGTLMLTSSASSGAIVLAFGFLFFVVATELLAGGKKAKPAELPANLTIEDIISWKRQEEVTQAAGYSNGTTVYPHN